MAKPSEKLMDIEADRLSIIHTQQKQLRKRLESEQTKVFKGSKTFLPGDEKHKKDLAILWKLGNPHMSFTKIANQIGEHKTVVRAWFKEDPYVMEKYEFYASHFRDAVHKLMENFGLEAMLTLVTLMRFGSEKYMFESANSILDRGGTPKLTAAEVKTERTVEHTWEDQEKLKDQIRELPEELQEEAIKAIDQLEDLLAKASQNGKKPKEAAEDING